MTYLSHPWARGVAASLATAALCFPANAANGPAPRLIELQPHNGLLRAAIAPGKGAEMSSLELRWKGQWVELLYRGRDFAPTDDFEGRAPILWPATGRNQTKAGQSGWTWQGTDYPLRIHGFARDNNWRIISTRTTGASPHVDLELVDDAQTRAVYPFGFRMRLRYQIRGSQLTILHKLRAASDNGGAMPFSIGNHMAFIAGLTPGASGAQTRLFADARRVSLLNPDSSPAGKFEAIDLSKGKSLAALGKRKAVSLIDFPAHRAQVRMTNADGLSLTVSHAATRYPHETPILFNLWGDLDKGFFSPEPWVGKQNSLERQDGVILLKPGEHFEWRIEVRLDLPRK